MTPLLKINKSWKEKLKRCLVLYVAVILWIYQPGISAGAKCGRPGRTAFSIYKPTENAFNESAVIRYSCDKEGHVLLGVTERRCLWNGSWSDELPVCSKLAKIEKIEQPFEEVDMGQSNSVDGNISTCTEQPQNGETMWTGYLLSSVNVTAVRIAVLGVDEIDIDVTIQGEMEGKKCTTKKAGSEIVVKSTRTVTFSCPEGTVGNAVHLKCSHKALRICEVSVLLPPDPSSCLAPDLPLHGSGFKKIMGKQTVYQFQCNDGYKKWGAVVAICQTDGRWSPRSPICDEIYCHVPDKPLNGYVEYDKKHKKGVAHNGTARYGCNEGYYLDGQPAIRCHRWNEWDSPAPTCKSKSPETSTVSSSTTTLLTESRMETNEETCETFNTNVEGEGQWLPVDGPSSFRVLICPEGFHIEGSPAVTQCLSNGSWSYTSAICKKSFGNLWGSNWTPNLMLIAAVAAGAGTAIFILCLSVAFLVVKKRRQTQTNTTVFHLENIHHKDGVAEKNVSRQKHHSAAESYETVIERRSKSICTNPRKPRSALPNLPLDADPVYAQPFETVSTSQKMFNVTTTRKEDLYNTHIYAEPVDSRRTPPINIPVNVPVPRIRTIPSESTAKTNYRIEPRSSTPSDTQNCDKRCAIYDSSDSSSHNNGNFKTHDTLHRYSERADLSTLTKNIEYLELL